MNSTNWRYQEIKLDSILGSNLINRTWFPSQTSALYNPNKPPIQSLPLMLDRGREKADMLCGVTWCTSSCMEQGGGWAKSMFRNPSVTQTIPLSPANTGIEPCLNGLHYLSAATPTMSTVPFAYHSALWFAFWVFWGAKCFRETWSCPRIFR